MASSHKTFRQQRNLHSSLAEHLEHGGVLSIGRRKVFRPIAIKRPMHLVFRAANAKGQFSLLQPQHARVVRHLLKRWACYFEVRVYEFANSGNHLHVLVKSKTRPGLQNFLRVFAGQVAQRVTGAEKGSPYGKRFWMLLVYSKIIFWGRAFLAVKQYVVRNRLEALGLIAYRARTRRRMATRGP
ncbi:MAG: transposase [Deltaproteobacteria bacterium]|nr:transposase [Deltaproteobacteria bacterium]